MTEGQRNFLNSTMKICKEGRKSDLEMLLADCFGAQDNETFDKNYVQRITPRLLDVMREDSIPEFEKAMEQFSHCYI